MNKALLFQLWVFVIGFLASNLYKRDFKPLFQTLLALPVGWALFAICATIVYSAHFSAVSQIAVMIVLGVTTLALIGGNLVRGYLSNESMVLGAAGLAALTVIGLLVESLRIVTMTPDSTVIARFGQNIGLGNYEASRLIFSKWGPFVPLIHSITNLLDQKLYWQYQPVLSLNLVGIVFYTLYGVIRERKASWQSLIIATVLVSLMVLSNIFLFHAFYIHVNIISALYMYVFVFSLAKMQQQSGQGYESLALLSLIAFGLLRLEAPLFAIVILLVASFQPGWSYANRLKLIVPFVALFVAWHARVYFWLPENPDILNKRLVVAFAAILTGFGVFAAASAIKALDSIFKRTQLLTLLGLVVVSIIFTVLRPEHMLASFASIGKNALLYGNWGLTWYAVVIIGMQLYASYRVAVELTWVPTVLVGYMLLVYDLAFFIDSPYHPGEVDSANRLLLQAMPLVLLHFSTLLKWVEGSAESVVKCSPTTRRSLSRPWIVGLSAAARCESNVTDK